MASVGFSFQKEAEKREEEGRIRDRGLPLPDLGTSRAWGESALIQDERWRVDPMARSRPRPKTTRRAEAKSNLMAGRLQKKIREAQRLRGLSPSETIEIGSDLSAFAIELAEAARRAKR